MAPRSMSLTWLLGRDEGAAIHADPTAQVRITEANAYAEIHEDEAGNLSRSSLLLSHADLIQTRATA